MQFVVELLSQFVHLQSLSTVPAVEPAGSSSPGPEGEVSPVFVPIPKAFLLVTKGGLAVGDSQCNT